MRTAEIYGNLPLDLGVIDISPKEMLYWLYCPIKQPRGELYVPSNLLQFTPIIQAVQTHLSEYLWYWSYIYITAKTLWVTPENPGNRPGWHSDGFLTHDLNYIWYDTNPTVFYSDGKLYSFTQEHEESLAEMDKLCEPFKHHWHKYPNKHLLMLDQTVLHKVDTCIESGYRTFVKISVSDAAYALEGNSTNEKIILPKSYNKRSLTRNCPQS